MTHEEFIREQTKRGLQEYTQEELENKADTCRFMMSELPEGVPTYEWYKNELGIIEEILREKSYAIPEPIDEEAIENNAYLYGL